MFSSRFGRRRGWALGAQLLLIVALAGLGSTSPVGDLGATAVLALAVAFASAMQDTVIDAYRVEILEEQALAAGAATATFGWRVGQVGAGAGGLILGDLLPWSAVFAVMAGAIMVGVVTMLLSPEPLVRSTEQSLALEARAEAWLASRRALPRWLGTAAAWLWAACVCPFLEFTERRGWFAVLLFILLYKFGDAVLGVMKVPFFLETGFSKTEIAEIAAVRLRRDSHGRPDRRRGRGAARIMRGLLVCGVAMALSNLVFVLQAWVGPDLGVLALTVSVENINRHGDDGVRRLHVEPLQCRLHGDPVRAPHLVDGDGADGAVVGRRLVGGTGELVELLRADDDRRDAGTAVAVVADAAIPDVRRSGWLISTGYRITGMPSRGRILAEW